MVQVVYDNCLKISSALKLRGPLENVFFGCTALTSTGWVRSTIIKLLLALSTRSKQCEQSINSAPLEILKKSPEPRFEPRPAGRGA